MPHPDPTFGWDPWLNASTRPGTPLLAAAAPVYDGADATDGSIHTMPDGLDYYGSYVDNYGGYPRLVARFGTGPVPFLLSYTIFGNPALCADVEPGAMHNSDIGPWLDRVAWKDAQGNSWAYTSASNMGDLIAAAAGRPFIRISAHYGFGPHICGPGTCGYPQAHWTQWADTGPNGENYDRLVGSYLPVAPAPPKPPPIPPAPKGVEFMSVAITSRPDGTVVVVAEGQPAGPGKLGEVFALWSTAPAGPDSQPVWHGVPGKVNHLWVSLGTPGS